MKRLELISLYDGLIDVRSLKGKSEDIVKFRYAVEKNIDKMAGEINSVINMEKSIEKPPEGYKKYQEERLKLLIERAKKNEKGEPVIKQKSSFGDVYDIEDMELFVKEAEALKDKYKKEIDEYEEILKKRDSFLAEEIKLDFELFTIKLDRVPDDITNEQMRKILLIIDEEI